MNCLFVCVTVCLRANSSELKRSGNELSARCFMAFLSSF